ncbi:hypothetical protein E2493_15730 [Sphingomonas parva]|uniref:DUF4138 domain-containing protein n=1 Tax=Sphingomonas parva TaxID=2555898 RepID=A0A4Y8ZMY1_9SPHN|nr:hypothetical protein [Sphingomonas parva]TFI57314.1 hypothetical protein E2493_15730 [Sphingomonas parva]
MAALLAAALSAPAAAAEFKIALQQAPLLHGRGGLHAADSRTAGSLVRVIAPGSPISKRGTVRVLVMNLGQPAFVFGPASVSLTLADGTALPKVPVAVFNRGEALVAREVRRAGAVDRRVKGDLAGLAQQGASGRTIQSISGAAGPNASAAGAAEAGRQDRGAEELPGARLLGALDGVLRPEQVGPQEAAGGYLVFELPKALRAQKTDLPLTILVKAGGEEHRFAALLKRD